MRAAALALLALAAIGCGAPAITPPEPTTVQPAPEVEVPEYPDLAHEPLKIVQDSQELTCTTRAARARALRAIEDLGANTVRIMTKRDCPAQVDQAIRQVHAAGLEPLVSVLRMTIAEARPFVRRHADQVEFWSIWNEPNHPTFSWGPVTADPRTYLDYYRKAYPMIHRLDPDARVIFGEFANDDSKALRIMAGYLTTPSGDEPAMYATEFGVIIVNEWAGMARYDDAVVAQSIKDSWRIAWEMGLQGMTQYKLNSAPLLTSGAPNVRDGGVFGPNYEPTARSAALTLALSRSVH